MKKITLCSLAVLGIFFSSTLISCNAETDQEISKAPTSELLSNFADDHASCSYVDGRWPSSAVLVSSLQSLVGSTADTNMMYNQNSAIKTFWRGTSVSAPFFRFVQNGTNWASTQNAVSYGNGNILYGEGIFKLAKSKDASNLVNIMILAHEYGHQLQYAFGLPSVKEKTVRPNELEADAMAGYYLRRGLGKTLFSQIATAYEFAAAIGDNSTESSDHHGTAPQRRSAVRLGFLLADPSNVKLTASQFDYNFFYYYNGVLSGNYRMAKPEGISEESHEYMMSHFNELKKIQNGQMSDKDYFELK